MEFLGTERKHSKKNYHTPDIIYNLPQCWPMNKKDHAQHYFSLYQQQYLFQQPEPGV
jgi:hypothetical protein